MQVQAAIFNHLIELRFRIFYLLGSLLLTYITCYVFYFELLYLFIRPFLKFENSFIFTNVTEVFSSSLTVCFVITMFLNMLLAFYQIWCFIIPSLYKNERKTLNSYAFLFLFVNCGIFLFIYFFLLAKIYYFFLNFQIQDTLLSIHLQARIFCYIQFTIQVYCLLQILLTFPLFIFFLFEFNYINVFSCIKNRKYIFMISLLLASVISPPEIITQLLLAFFLIFCFESLIYIVLLREIWKKN